MDSASPVVSVALGDGEHILARREIAIARSSEALLQAVDAVLTEAGTPLADVDGLVGLRGPGSFTGLRVGMATLLGLHQALGVPATAVPTLEVLALAAPSEARRVAAVVDALRGEWFTQLFEGGEAVSEPEILTLEQLVALAPDCIVGHGVDQLAPALPDPIAVSTAGELAPLALRHVADQTIDWSPANLLDPMYLRPPAIHSRRSGS